MAFVTLEDLGKGVALVPWIKILLVFGVAWLLLTSTNLTQRYNSPPWVWMSFGAIGALGTLLDKGYVYRGLKPVNWCFD